MFTNLECFVTIHRRCGDFIAEVGEPTDAGYLARMTCAYGALFKQWITPSRR
jgi:hypothetical protein